MTNSTQPAHTHHLPPPLAVVAGGRGRGLDGHRPSHQHPVAVISLPEVTGGHHWAWSPLVVVAF